MPILTYRCCNSKCGIEYDSSATNPRCPTCRSPRKQWVPSKIAVRKVATQIDRDVRDAATAYGATNFRRPYYGEPMAMKRSGLPPPGATLTDNLNQGKDGWDVRLWQDENGRPVMKSTCEPAGMLSRVRPRMGVAKGGQSQGPGLGAFTVFEGRTTERTVPV